VKLIAEEQDSILDIIRNYEDLFFRAENDINSTVANINWLIRPVLNRFIKRQRVNTFRCLNFYCQFFSKLTLEVPELQDDIEQSWLVANDIRSIYRYNWVQQNRILELASRRFAQVTKNFVRYFKDEIGQWGNGATYNTSRQSGYNGKVSCLLKDDFLDVKSWMILAKYCDFDDADPIVFWLMGMDRQLTPSVSKLQLVPKGLYKKRPISMEPLHLSYFQQRARSALERCVRESGLVIDFENQEISQTMALEGSKLSWLPTGYATRDLRSASDDITLALIRRLCKYCPDVYELLYLLRTDCIEDSKGNSHIAWCYAGMGNAVTFRLESIVFSVLVEVAIEISNQKKKSHLKIRHNDYRVYGDDIIIPNYVVEVLDWVLDQLNFTVNTDKSYDSSTSFREACGIEAYKGHDVTPLRLSRKIKPEFALGRRITNTELDSLFDLLKAYLYVFDRTRRYITKLVLQYNKRLASIPFIGSSDRFGFPSINESEPCYHKFTYEYTGKLIGYFVQSNTLYGMFERKEITVARPYEVTLVTDYSDMSDEIAYFGMQQDLGTTRRMSLSLPDDLICRRKGEKLRTCLRTARTTYYDEIHSSRALKPLIKPLN
jgi:hypothetical protein